MKTRLAGRYRFDFALTVLTGNARRYEILRPQIDKDDTIEARWYPIRTWREGDPLRILPGALRVRARHFLDSWKFLVRPAADCAIMHAFETTYMYILLKKIVLRSRVIVVNNPDGTITNRTTPGPLGMAIWRSAVRKTDLFVPWTEWGARRMRVEFPEIPAETIFPLHPGLDLENWPFRPARQRLEGEPFRVLFVGGNLKPKGIEVLLDAFETDLDGCELHVATQSVWLHRHPEIAERIDKNRRIALHLDLEAGSPEIMELFWTCDVFALPTYGDLIPWVAFEALATGIPTIMTPVGAIEEVIHDGETGLIIPCEDAGALVQAIERIRTSPELAERLRLAGRELVEEKYDAATNAERLTSRLKEMVDGRRAGPLARRVRV